MSEAGARRRRLNPFSRDNPLAASYLCVFLYSSGEAALHVLVPPYLAGGRGHSPSVIGAVLAVFALSSLVMRLPVGAGYTARRVRPLLLVGGLLSAGAFAVVPFTGDTVLLAVLMAMDGVGWAMATTTQLTVMVASRPESVTIASAMGWYSGFTGLGHALGGITAGAAADRLGYTAGFLVLAAFPALATVVMLRSLPAQLAAARARDAGGTGDDRDDGTIRTEPRHSALSVLRSVGSLPAAVYGGALIMFFINVHSALLSTFQPVLALAAGLTLTQIGALSSVRSLTSSVTRIASGPLFSRISGRSLTTPMFMLGVVTLYLVPVVRESFWLQVPVFAVAGLSRGLLRVTGASSAFEDTSDDGRPHGLVSAFLHMGLDLGKVCGPPIGGVLAEWVGVAAMFKVTAIGLLAAYLVFWLMIARHRNGGRRRLLGRRS